MKSLNILGRFLFALPFGIAGVNHFIMKDAYLGILESTTIIPNQGYMIFITGLAMVAACVAIMINKFMKLACYSLAGLLLLFIATIHIPGLFSDHQETFNLAVVNILKDMSLMGGALVIGTVCPKRKKK